MKLDFYYYSYQCPLNWSMLQLLEAYRDRIEINTYDISADRAKCKELNIFYPTLLVLNDQYRYYAPFKKQFLDTVCRGVIPKETPYIPTLGTEYVEKIIEPLTRENLCIACECCGETCKEMISAKREFIDTVDREIYGYLHKTSENHLLGGVEYLPSIDVSYDIPHEVDTAFVTCLYCSDMKYDFKTAPLKKLEQQLKNQYRRILVITDEEGVFPNGNMKYFESNGYSDEGVIYEDANYCRLHLMSKILNN